MTSHTKTLGILVVSFELGQAGFISPKLCSGVPSVLGIREPWGPRKLKKAEGAYSWDARLLEVRTS